ncbi:MAG TPA: polymer-forming cytoskeletal protein [Noviherbaspirillum sp.]|nr:polymer-forming cytoskeletal protein [Noviherbaspirillum sp.]
MLSLHTTISKMRIGMLLVCLSVCLSISPAYSASSQLQTSEAGNTYISGSDLVIATPVAADLFAAGGRVSVEREVGADAAVAGGSVTIRAPVRQDLRAAGGHVDIEGNTDGELVAAGGNVRVGEAAVVAGSAWLAGGDVTVAGKIGKGARIYAGNIAISGEIDGDAHLYGQQIKLLPGAIIRGGLFYTSPNELIRDPSAQVLGTLTHEPTPPEWSKEHGPRRAMSWFHPFFVLSMLAAGMLLYVLFPAAALGPQRAIRQYPLRSLLLGLALVFTIPPVAILFMVTVIGLPIGFALLLLYPLSLMLGYLATAFLIGRQVATAAKQPEPASLKRYALFLLLALIVLSIAAAIPFLGGIVMIAAVVLGLGGWAVWIQTSYHGARAAHE